MYLAVFDSTVWFKKTLVSHLWCSLRQNCLCDLVACVSFFKAIKGEYLTLEL